MSALEPTLAAMDAAESYARLILTIKAAIPGQQIRSLVDTWAADRLRLIARDRGTLERHAAIEQEMEPAPVCLCGSSNCPEPWPCPEAQAVIDYWTQT